MNTIILLAFYTVIILNARKMSVLLFFEFPSSSFALFTFGSLSNSKSDLLIFRPCSLFFR